LNWPTGFWGDAELIGALANFFNKYFQPANPVQKEHVTIAPGGAGCLDALLYNICDSSDGVLVPNPYWSMISLLCLPERIILLMLFALDGNDIFFRVRSQVMPIPIIFSNVSESLNEECFFPALHTAYQTAPCAIKALVLSNPHNPLGRCYSSSFLEKCLKFCRDKNIHLISDEVFALSTFKCPEAPDSTPFTSMLSMDVESLGGVQSMVHVVWSFSKDLGCSGMKLVSSPKKRIKLYLFSISIG
jgi:aspartate/methionine/tyrosine aminotransferase